MALLTESFGYLLFSSKDSYELILLINYLKKKLTNVLYSVMGV